MLKRKRMFDSNSNITTSKRWIKRWM